MITCNQIRAARALIGWKQSDLAAASGLSEISIKNLERGATDPRASALDAIQKALLKGGVVFLDAGDTRDGGPGVRLSKDGAAASIPLEDLNAENDEQRERRDVSIRKSLTDQQWDRIEGELPGRAGDPGCNARDNRLFVEAVLWIARTGSPWRDLPDEFGKWYTAYTRCRRWSQSGVWRDVFEALSDDSDFEFVMIDETICLRPAKTRPKRGMA